MSQDHADRIRARLAKWRETIPASTVPEGRSGPWAVERFHVTESDVRVALTRAVSMGRRGYTPPGTYTRLVRDGGGTWMSDVYDEVSDAVDFVSAAEGDVLVTGLGLGMVVHALAAKPEVAHVTVVERDVDVVNLVAATLPERRVTLVVADAFEWRLPARQRWDVAFHDIWRDISPDDVPEMKRLRDRFSRRVPSQSFWAGEELYRRVPERFLLGTPPRPRRRVPVAPPAERAVEEASGYEPADGTGLSP